MSLTKEDIVRIVEEEDVKFIRMQFVDVLGQMKNVAITVSQLDRALDGEISIDGSSIEGFASVNESDQYLRARSGHLRASIRGDPSGARWPVSSAMCTMPTALPLWATPAAVLKRVVDRCHRTWAMTISM